MALSTYLVVAAILVVTVVFLFTSSAPEIENFSVAFIGNSFQFVNDLPRFMEALGEGKIEQDSTLHGSLSFATLLLKGNGMQRRWNRSNALMDNGLKDLGACTVPQLLLGYDERLYNFEDYFTLDGKNPCFENEAYMAYALEAKNRTGWDFVILNDQSMRPAYSSKRQISSQALQQTYAPLLIESGSTPVFILTHGYWRTDINMSDLVDVPTFSSLLYHGYMGYKEALAELLPLSLAPRIAPVGLAFLVIWEENRSFWGKLIGIDDYHPTPHGTYLMGCVLYMTLCDELPPPSSRFTSSLFSRARRMQLVGSQLPLPTTEEALYLQWIAKRVTLEGYLPKSLDLDME